MDSALTALLHCPVCAAPMEAVEGPAGAGGLVCASGHRFDRARQGYFNLLTGKPTGFVSDTPAMVAAREAFLGAGHYQPLVEVLRQRCTEGLGRSVPPVMLDAGAGTGHYLRAVLDAAPQARAVAMDLSSVALRRAARKVPEALSLAWDLWRPLPLRSGSIDVIVNVFAPRHAVEFARILSPCGRLLVVTPGPGHLEQLHQLGVTLAVDPDKPERLAASLQEFFELDDSEKVSYPMSLSRANIEHVALMGPAAHHLDSELLHRRLAGVPDPSTVTASFRISVFRRR